MAEVNPALNPPPPGERLNLADTPEPKQRYDVVIDGVGYMLWRQTDDSLPSRIYQIVPETLTWSQQFIERTNVSGDFGDNQQDFFMTYTMRDWSGGEGQKFFRQQTDKDRTYWDGSNVRPTETPGAVVVGAREIENSLPHTGTGSGNMAYNIAFIKETGAGTIGDALVCVVNDAVGSALYTFYSTDGGVTWTEMCATSRPAQAVDACDLIGGDNGTIYLLVRDWLASSESKIFSCSSVGATTWTAHTNLAKIINMMEWFNGGMYCCSSGALFQTVDVSGGAGDGTLNTIKDLGGGQVIDMMAAGGVLYLLYCSAQGDHRLMQYDGTDVVEIARLPKGWKSPKPSESAIDTGGNRRLRCLSYQDGIVYVGGSVPGNDALITQGNTFTYRAALWFYDGGDSGLLWQSNVMLQTQKRAGGATCVIDGGIIVFADHIAERLMAYDPRTGGVFTLSSISNVPNGSNIPPIWRLEYDPINSVILGVWEKDFQANLDPFFTITSTQINRWQLRKQGATSGYVTTSLFDFDSSLPKWFAGVTINGQTKPYSGDAAAGTFDIYYQLDGVDGAYTLLKAGAVPGTEYRIDQSAHSISIKVVLNNNGDFGPSLQRLAVRAAPIQQIFRQRAYVLALINDVVRVDGSMEPLTPAEQRKALETSLTKNVPILVSDEAMTNARMVFDASNTEIRMIRENEYIAFVYLREV